MAEWPARSSFVGTMIVSIALIHFIACHGDILMRIFYCGNPLVVTIVDSTNFDGLVFIVTGQGGELLNAFRSRLESN